mmetsp:Transcript_13727/g.39537  ORF Transcript_13727/g.39537 Transcript_13727/m.39537 type:complete len:355 (-) Transcript_13727:73-1137(-)|eukprot:CAMPEP_0176043970 /NCGR_PEP_ID=MMETSP0120_2-20121206/21823_1 /TAXON_ID=160619 /ORGANISM="Kryptoperidinium foliaceum, Strain CCMP 1326" /LENGTH=354 /DNA_ID=CAMNT_0017377379 /DNA_START=21 /DNA_END=1085 /DNA_ORIENTATION=-
MGKQACTRQAAHGARLRSAASLLMDALVDDASGQPAQEQARRDTSGNSISFECRADARSEAGSSAVSSHLGAPTWQRMLRPFALAMSKRLAAAEAEQDSRATGSTAPVDEPLEAILTNKDGGGGGNVSDVEHLLSNALEAINLSDKETGFVLLTSFYHLQPNDLPVTSRTWRSLLLVVLHIAIGQTVTNGTRAEVSRYELMKHVRHWWSPKQMESARETFESRGNFVKAPPRRSDLAKLYFQLREDGLRMSGQESSVASAEALGDLSSLFGDGDVGLSKAGGGASSSRDSGNGKMKTIFADIFAMEAYEKMLQSGADDSSGLLEVSQSESVSSSSMMSIGKDFGQKKEKTVISL